MRTFPRVLVTGASGFLGQSVVHRLLSGRYHVTAVGHQCRESPWPPEVEYRRVDLADARSTRQVLTPWRWDAVINLAGPVRQPPTSPISGGEFQQHVHIVCNVCWAIEPSWPGRFIHISSMEVYGMPERLPVDEEHPRHPRSPYGLAKCLAEDLCLAAARAQRFDGWVIRLPGLFAETRRSGAVYHFMDAALHGRPIIISATEPTPWDILHRDDAAEGILRALTAEESNPGVLNLSYGMPIELVAMATRIANMAGSESRVENLHNIRHPVFQMDIKKTQRLLQWPPANLEDRLAALWETLKPSSQEARMSTLRGAR